MRDSQHLNSVAPASPPAPPSPAETPALLPSFRLPFREEGEPYFPARPFLVPEPSKPPKRIPAWLVSAVVGYMLFDLAIYELLKIDIDAALFHAVLTVLAKAVRQ